jgi:Fungal Zn(2)-Cys(6) binuclear cluster domain
MSPAKASKRSANTCAECRARKVRCEGNRPVCTHCQRLLLGCSFQRSGTSEPESNFERRRVRLACTNCHALKARCSGSLPKCQRCRTKDIDCIYTPSKRASHNHGSYSLSDHGSVSGATPESFAEGSPSAYPRPTMRPLTFVHGRSTSTPLTPGLHS